MRFTERQTIVDFLGQLRAHNVHISLAATGGGARIQGLLWDLPGASSYLGSSFFSYPPEETDTVAGFHLKAYATPQTAQHLAMMMYLKSCQVLETRMRRLEQTIEREDSLDLLRYTAETQPIGIGVAASVASERIHRGDHRLNIAVMTHDKFQVTSLILSKDAGYAAREYDGELCDITALNALAHAMDFDQMPMYEMTRVVGDCAPNVSLKGQPLGLTPKNLDEKEARELFLSLPYFSPTGARMPAIPTGGYNLVPVTGRPLHEGHEGMAQRLEDHTGKRSIFVVATNVPPGYSKSLPSVQDLLSRAAMVRSSNQLNNTERGIFFSKSCLFVDMAKEHPGAGIAVGADALLRAFDPQWCGGLENTRSMFMEVADKGTSFFVFDRKQQGDNVLTGDVVLAQSYKFLDPMIAIALVKPLRGRWDISSTDIRMRRGLE